MGRRRALLSSWARFLLILAGLTCIQGFQPVAGSLSVDVVAEFPRFPGSAVGARLALAAWGHGRALATRMEGAAVDLLSKPLVGPEAVDSPAKSFRIVGVSTSRSGEESLTWPIFGSISSGFGYRRHPVTRRIQFHGAIDIRSRPGTPVMAPADGVVLRASRAGLIGRLVKVRTTSGLVLYFGHLSGFACRAGQTVRRGQVLGYTGSSGRATGPHLHFAVERNGRALNPSLLLGH